jgi:tRNA dimethylallyltransferase
VAPHAGESLPRPALVILVGPTAAGKTVLALRWAEALGAEVVSADSVQVYRHMDIGTAKPTREILERVPHHLIDVVDPDEPFSAARFVREADRAIAEIHSRGRQALVVAGTGLYVRALTRGLFPGRESDLELRERLRGRAATQGPQKLHETLRRVDPISAVRIHPNDSFRIVRALEVFYTTGEPISLHQSRHGFTQERYPSCVLGLSVEREELNQRIDLRVDDMMARGLVAEVEGLAARGYGWTIPAMRALGYRHVGMAIRGEMSMEDAVRLMKRDTRRYAKRQLTWFNAMGEVRWFRPEEKGKALEEAKRFLREARNTRNALDNLGEDC